MTPIKSILNKFGSIKNHVKWYWRLGSKRIDDILYSLSFFTYENEYLINNKVN